MLTDYSYECWASVLCQQIAQNLSVISACLPCLYPFIISILAGRAESETVNLGYSAPPCIRQYFGLKSTGPHPNSSRSSRASITPLAGDMEEAYCRPLATYGLDRASTQSHPSLAGRFPANVAKPIFTKTPPENIFNRLIEVEVPLSRPGTSSSNMKAVEKPQIWGDVGVLPTIDWDSDSNASSASKRISAARQPTAEYVFNRQKVISVSDERCLYDDGFKQFAPPLPSPRMPRRPPRAF